MRLGVFFLILIYTETEEEGALLLSNILFLAEDMNSDCIFVFCFFPVVDTAKVLSSADASLVVSSLRALFQRLKYLVAINLTFALGIFLSGFLCQQIELFFA